ncbi:ferredoxin NADP reductase [Buchnera aphidicola (Nipponaphis monzeni)]|uniref:Flavodoxin/ferredoxin--NADP reductase n=1 Tax=Buchnera aphidicola (Nipponaphis monzeni) TaxID=2495405 RepID=A0A455TAS4_9GAMM|nr:FAD-binding oxidoreductase [Buchnera aphidicola]BBI01438.1 ferredoxin NADP reductase [Buchnera aphidicola (Nipponaphis monzeni)]
MTIWINATITKVKIWTPNLFSIFLKAPILPFIAGQFAKLSLINNDGKRIQRAYSYTNSPNNKNLEFYITLIPSGKITELLYKLKPLDNIMISKQSFGFFTLNEIPNCQILWMFATGTAIGPYCSILQEYENIKRFKTIILIHAVRYVSELNYLPLIKKLQKKYKNKLRVLTIVSREYEKDSLCGRIPELLLNKKIENKIGLEIDINNSHIMLCGNPFMVKDTLCFFKKKYNIEKHFRRKPGHITTENYW